ncbi:9691_t:CDS:2 [Ambispora leptoticha]|uniref:9691_t:CDS:1 n=1 Tax=Ambispora leptoticha TaxID=144679 RepID=A0A9N8Z0I1_9GLOM|nr:9691_t:CDS:2 [Ambispora leptoticha]
MSQPTPRGRKAPPEEEDAAKLAFGEDFEHAEFLFISEAALLLERTPPGQAQTSNFQKTQAYVNTFSKFHNQEAVTELRKTLLKYNIHKYELAQLANLCPEEVDEVKSLIPSLPHKLEDEKIRQILDEIAALKKYQSQ